LTRQRKIRVWSRGSFLPASVAAAAGLPQPTHDSSLSASSDAVTSSVFVHLRAC